MQKLRELTLEPRPEAVCEMTLPAGIGWPTKYAAGTN
jgi:hypothetical protein